MLYTDNYYTLWGHFFDDIDRFFINYEHTLNAISGLIRDLRYSIHNHTLNVIPGLTRDLGLHTWHLLIIN